MTGLSDRIFLIHPMWVSFMEIELICAISLSRHSGQMLCDMGLSIGCA
jgi:hypothetical protein